MVPQTRIRSAEYRCLIRQSSIGKRTSKYFKIALSLLYNAGFFLLGLLLIAISEPDLSRQMTALLPSQDEYYFVPLGRERGGFLDILGLPANADVAAIAAKENEHRRQIKKDAVEQRAKWKKKQQAGEITPQELENKYAEIKTETTNRETECNDLKRKFEVLQAERRKLANEGRRDTTTAWENAYASFKMDRESFWNFLTKARPLPTCTADYLNAVAQRWLKTSAPFDHAAENANGAIAADVAADLCYLDIPEINAREKWFKEFLERHAKRLKQSLDAQRSKGADASPVDAKAAWSNHKAETTREWNSFQLEVKNARKTRAAAPLTATNGEARLALHQLFGAANVSLATVSGLTVERELVALLAADALWNRLKATPRTFWRRRMESWCKEIGELGPGFVFDSPMPTWKWGRRIDGKHNEQWPTLSRVPNRFIDRLEKRELGALGHTPDRSKSAVPEVPESLAALLAALRAHADAQSKGDSMPIGDRAAVGRSPQATLDLADLAELLESIEVIA
jgi:hypothetical protein